MTTTTHVCDRCQQAIEADRHRLIVASGSLRHRRSEVDLCRDCMAWLLSELRTSPTSAAAAAMADLEHQGAEFDATLKQVLSESG